MNLTIKGSFKLFLDFQNVSGGRFICFLYCLEFKNVAGGRFLTNVKYFSPKKHIILILWLHIIVGLPVTKIDSIIKILNLQLKLLNIAKRYLPVPHNINATVGIDSILLEIWRITLQNVFPIFKAYCIQSNLFRGNKKHRYVFRDTLYGYISFVLRSEQRWK